MIGFKSKSQHNLPLVIVLASILSGCASQTYTGGHSEHSELHALYVDRNGYAISEETWASPFYDTDTWYRPERPEDATDNPEEELIRAIVDQAREELDNCTAEKSGQQSQVSRDMTSGPAVRKEILIFIHGGLNTNANSLSRTKRLLGGTATAERVSLEGKTELPTACRFPIFINWRSGPFSSYKDHLIHIRQGKDGGALAKLTSPVYFMADVGRTIGNAPRTWLTEGKHSFRSIAQQEFTDYERLPDCSSGDDYACKPTFDPKCEVGDAHRTWRRAAWLLTAPARIVTTPIVSEFGKSAWDVMLHRSNLLFWKLSDFDTSGNLTEKPSANDGMGSGALAKLVRELQRALPDMGTVDFTLVGHSMGAIAINRLLVAKPELPVRNIVFLAAADSVRNTRAATIQYLEQHPEARFYSWMLHPDNEARELSKYGIPPSGTLLTWIDNMFTTPESHLDYRFGRWDTIKSTEELFDQSILDRMRLMVFPRDASNIPLRHGDFSACEFWKLEEIEALYTN